MASRSETLLLIADSERDANMLYAVGMFVADPFVYLRVNNRPYVLLSDLEFDRARKQAPHCRVLSLSRYQDRLRRDGVRKISLARVVREVLREKKLKKVLVPANFPHGLARQLRDLKVKVKLKPGAFFPEREAKSADEVKKISAALMMAEVGMAEAIHVLRNSKISKNGRLIHHDIPLTAEKLRAVINIAVIQAGGLAHNTIVACGRQACEPNETGCGVLRAHEPIVIDIFPRSQRTGYFGDITRTVVRGKAKEPIRKMFATVQQGQHLAFKQVSHGVPAAKIHRAVQEYFEQQGYRTDRRKGLMRGFFHAAGHGLGLDIHEAPRLHSASEDVLRAGNVVTLEPGLYYPELGGVRLEDVALVKHNGARNLTKFEKSLEV